MIGIKLDGDGDFLELPPDVEITLNLENPILGDGERISPGSFSMPFNIPGGDVSPTNAAKLKNGDVIENAEVFTQKKATLYYEVPFRAGVLKSDNMDSPDQIESNFIFGLSQINESFKTEDLRDVVSEVVVIDNTPITKKIFVKRRDSADSELEINGKEYSGALSGLVTPINTDAAVSLDSGVAVPYAVHHASGSSPLGGFTAPYLEIKLVYYNTVLGVPTYTDATDPLLELWVKPSDDEKNYWVEAFDMEPYYVPFDSFFEGYQTGVYPDNRFRIPLILNSNKYESDTEATQDVVNMINLNNSGDGLLRNDANFGVLSIYDFPFKVQNRNSLQPFALLKWVLDKIADHFGFTIEGTFYDDPKIADMLIDNTSALDEPQNFLGTKKFVFWRRSFNMNELVPSCKVTEFLAALQSRFNITIYYNEVLKKVVMNKREDIARSYSYEDITRVSSPKGPSSDERVTGIKLRVPKDPNDLSSVEESVSTGTPQKELIVNCGRLHEMKFHYFGSFGRELVRVQQKYKSEFGLRLFNYRGIVTTTPNTHPWANIHGVGNDTYDIQRIFDNNWKYWLISERGRKSVQIECEFPFRFFLSLDWEKKYRYDRVNYLIKSITVRLRNKSIKASTVQLISMR